MSVLEKMRLSYEPKIPPLLNDLDCAVFKEKRSSAPPLEPLKELFPHTFNPLLYHLEKGEKRSFSPLRIGVFFSGGQAAGGHNVIAGILDAGAEVVGFLGGPSGFIANRSIEIRNVDLYRNQGGFDLLGTGRTKIETEKDLASCLKTALECNLDGLVIVGGDDSNTNGALLAEYFLSKKGKTRIVGVPKTIDGDLRSSEIELSFGFDSACKTYSEIIGNIARDALSAKKYYHFIKLMGRAASHIALECALATRPNMVLIGEEKKGLAQIVGEIADLIQRRFEAGKEYGVILIPEGLIEFAPDGKEIFRNLDSSLDPHGNVQLSQIPVEKWILGEVEKKLSEQGFQGKFNGQTHFLGYEGRSCLPTNFDANYCYALGKLSFLAVRDHFTGVICAIQNLNKKGEEWKMGLVPIVQLMHFEIRSGARKAVIKKNLVDIKGDFFIKFLRLRKKWEIRDHYCCPGPIQFFGGPEVADSAPLTLG